MNPPKIHFLTDSVKESDVSFFETLVGDLGQSTPEDAETIVSIGGDGTLLRALRLSIKDHFTGKSVCGLVPPGSNSVGFRTNKNIITAQDLLSLLATAERHALTPLETDITFADGETVWRYSFNDISIRPYPQHPVQALREKLDLTDIDLTVQSALLNLRTSFAKAAGTTAETLMGGGLIFATPYGSTAMNAAYGGPVIDLKQKSLIVTGIATNDDAGKKFQSIIHGADTVFDVSVQSLHKRPVIVSFDSFGVAENKRQSPVQHVHVALSPTKQAQLIIAY